ncbi:MAG: hypothetical protein Q9195_003418 [Heterodermia aff. obscurata]
MKVPAAPVLVAALGAEVALAAPVVADDLVDGVADVNLMERADTAPEITQGPSIKESVSLLTPTTTAVPPAETCTEAADGQIKCNPVKLAPESQLATHVPIPLTAFTADIGTIPTAGVEARDEDETPCIAKADCAGISPPLPISSSNKPPSTPPPSQPSQKITSITVIPPTPLPTSSPSVTHSSSIVPVPPLYPVTDPLPNYPLTESAYCWEATNGQVHCVWTAVEPTANPNTKNKNERTVQTAAGGLLEREVGAVPTTLATVGVGRRAEEVEEKETSRQYEGDPRLPEFTEEA